jgi:CubicO group peptidase (beta-lactamase class C family)
MRYGDPADAGFSADALERARQFFENRRGAAFMVVSGGAVVASWGDVDRRFPTHSMRKSLLSALYGAHGEEIDLSLDLDSLAIDDMDGLTTQERHARVVDLLASRSGVYHPAAAEAAEMSDARPERGAYAPGTHWWYNNWDFNVAGTVFRQLTGLDVFGAFDEDIARPLGMQDYRPIDGSYFYDRNKSLHPAYTFRMSTRDLARFGLLFARGGRWRDKQVIPASWVAESTAAYSETDTGDGYGYMWWVGDDGGFSARGYGGHVLVVYPRLDLVMVVRADTYHDHFLANRAIDRLVQRVIQAGGRDRSPAPRLVPMAASPDVEVVPLPSPPESYVGTVALGSGDIVTIGSHDGRLTVDWGRGAYELMPEGGPRFRLVDSGDPLLFDFDEQGRVRDVWSEQLTYLEAAHAVRAGRLGDAVDEIAAAVERFPESATLRYNLARALAGTDQVGNATDHLRDALGLDPDYREASGLLRRLLVRRYAWMGGVLLILCGGALYLRARAAHDLGAPPGGRLGAGSFSKARPWSPSDTGCSTPEA